MVLEPVKEMTRICIVKELKQGEAEAETASTVTED